MKSPERWGSLAGLPLAAVLLFSSPAPAGERIAVESPGGRLKAVLFEEGGDLFWELKAEGTLLIERSRLGLRFGSPVKYEITGWNASVRDSLWRPVAGKRARVRNHYRLLSLDLRAGGKESHSLRLEVRLYDDGAALRYLLRDGGPDFVRVWGEFTEFRFCGDGGWYWYRTERPPAGPRKAEEIDGPVSYPLVSRIGGRLAVAFTEAYLVDYPWAVPASRKGERGFFLEPFRRPLAVSASFRFPWRVVMVGRRPADLRDSDIVANLNPKADRRRFAWVRPGVALWDWRAWGYRADDGFVYGLNLPSWKRMIDFAAEQGLPYLLIDADWYGKEFRKDSNPFTGGKAADVKKAIEYGKKKGVGLILYLNHLAARKYGIEKITKAYADWGAKGIKYGFMRIGDPRRKVAWTHEVARLCAGNRLLVDFHDGPIPPTGEEAYLPNFCAREFCHAQSDARRAFTPGAFVRMMHVNALAGPLDQDNGLFDLEDPTGRPRIFARVPSTIVSEAARTLIPFSGLVVLPDAADSYRKHPELFRFIALQRQPWERSRTLSSHMEHWISVMRESHGVYLVASVTDEEARVLPIRLDFLPRGKVYRATIFSDGPGAHYLKNRTAYRVERREVRAGEVVTARLAPGGGHCMILEEKK